MPNVVDTPTDVKKVVAASVNFLNTYILGDEYKPWNTFFSGSFKGHGVGFAFECEAKNDYKAIIKL